MPVPSKRGLSSIFYKRTQKMLNSVEQALLSMPHIYIIINQIMFFSLCDSGKKVNSVYSLMLYNVITYCLQYVRELISKEDWVPMVNISEHSRIRHLAMSATSLVLEWTKAITFIITVVFLVLSFSANQGLENYQPTFIYTFLTALYYIATEKTYFPMFPAILTKLQQFESMETLWATVILKSFTIVISAIFALFQIFNRNYRLAASGLYINVIVNWHDGENSCFRELRRELAILDMFSDASKSQLGNLDDVCSVCLCTMVSAKVTPCNHMFHKDCLRTWLKSSVDCPMCKSQIVSYDQRY